MEQSQYNDSAKILRTIDQFSFENPRSDRDKYVYFGCDVINDRSFPIAESGAWREQTKAAE